MFSGHRTAATIANCAAMAGIFDAEKMSTLERAARGYVESPAYRRLCRFMDSPAYKAAMGLAASPLYRAMQEPEFLRRIREQEEIMKRIFPSGA